LVDCISEKKVLATIAKGGEVSTTTTKNEIECGLKKKGQRRGGREKERERERERKRERERGIN
jgi:hypothetical protein